MKSTEINTSIIQEYVGLLENLSLNDKLELISKLTKAVQTELNPKKNAFKKAFGALETHSSAEEIIKEIRGSRVSTREIESF